jgi:hypothetical protein
MTLVSTSDKKYTSIFGWGIIGYKTFGTTWAPVARDSTSPPQLHIFDANFDYVARTNDYEYFSWTYNWYYADSFELKINRYKLNVSEFVAGGFIAFKDEGDAWHVGIIQRIQKPLSSEGKQSETWTFIGQSYEAIFQDRICTWMTNVDTWSGDASYNGQTSNNMWKLVYREAYAPTDADRRYPSLHMETSANLGNTYKLKVRFEKLSTVLEKHVRYDPSYSYYLDWTGYGDGSANREQFTFKIRTGRNKIKDVKLAAGFGNVVGYDYIYTEQDMKTYIYLGGSGTGATRDISENPYNFLSKPTGRDRKEVFQDATDCKTTGDQRSRALELLNDMSSNQTVSFEFSPYTTDYVFLYDFKVGDEITVQIDNVVVMYSRLISATESYSEKGREVRLTVGKEKPDLKGMVKLVYDQVKRSTLV